MRIGGHVSIDRASRLLETDRKSIFHAVDELRIHLFRSGKKFKFIHLRDLSRIGRWIESRPKDFVQLERWDSVRCDEPGMRSRELAARIAAARRIKRESWGSVEVTDELLDAALADLRQSQGVAI